MLHNEIIKLIHAFQDGVVGLDADALRQVLTDDVVHHMPASFFPEPLVGREPVVHGLTSGIDQFFNLKTLKRRLGRIWVGEDSAAAEMTLECETLQGTPYSNEYVWIFEFRDGRISRLIENADTLRAARQLGMV